MESIPYSSSPTGGVTWEETAEGAVIKIPKQSFRQTVREQLSILFIYLAVTIGSRVFILWLVFTKLRLSGMSLAQFIIPSGQQLFGFLLALAIWLVVLILIIWLLRFESTIEVSRHIVKEHRKFIFRTMVKEVSKELVKIIDVRGGAVRLRNNRGKVLMRIPAQPSQRNWLRLKLAEIIPPSK